MLYLSRYLRGVEPKKNKYFIVDTDDDTETCITLQDLKHFVKDLRLQIEGVEELHRHDGIYVGRCIPYQDWRFATPVLTKGRVLEGVEVHLFKDGEITYICFHNDVMKDKARIRLSNYGKKMYWCTAVDAYGRAFNKTYSLVIDDNIEMLDQFCTSRPIGLTWDISECSDGKAVNAVYETIQYISSSRWSDFLIDRPERMQEWTEKVKPTYYGEDDYW